jgi:outer membrane protein
MKIFIILIIFFLKPSFLLAENNLLFYIESAFKNNPKLNAERENLKASKEDINISRSEFFPSVTISQDQTSSVSTNKTNQSGETLADSNTDAENKSISIDQKIFQGFQGYNSLKKSKLELEKANFKLRDIEQETILNAVSTYYDLVFSTKNENFNIDNVDLFERQVEFDNARLQKGEISLTDLAQSESSLASASAKLISAKTKLLTTKTNFERITRENTPNQLDSNFTISLDLPLDLKSALEISYANNPKLMTAKLNMYISEKELNIEKSKLSPTASLNYSKSESKDYSATIDDNEQETVKATISWPIIKGGKNYSSIKKYAYKKKQSKLLYKDAENEVKTFTANAWSVYQSSESILIARKAQLKAAEIANEGITLEYDSGNTRTTLEVIQSRSLLLDSRIAYAEAEKNFIISKFTLLAQLGNLSLNSLKG